MDFAMGGSGRSGDEQDKNQNSNRGKSSYYVLTTDQKAQLEASFELNQHPDEKQGEQLAKDLSLDPRQIKYWFQNRRTQQKNRLEQAFTIATRIENERIQCENSVLKETLNSALCPSCGGPPLGKEERELSMQNLLLENAKLKQEYENISNLLASYMQIQMRTQHALESVGGPVQCEVNREFDITNLDQDSDSSLSTLNDDDDKVTPNPTGESEESVDVEKARMLEVATAAMEALVRLVNTNEPLWDRSFADERFVVDRETYEKMFPGANNLLRSPDTHEESSKHSQVVSIGGMQLVEMFLNSDKWATLFPTIVSRAETIKVLDAGLLENRSGALQLMHEEMHVLSPLLPSREFFFLRYCKQVEVGAWAIADVSIDSFGGGHTPLCLSWRLPSGCMIRETKNGSSMVTWVEHVAVKDRIQTNWLYRDLVYNSIAYGAERWVMSLQRMCEKIASFSNENTPGQETEGVITSRQGRRSLLNLSHRMVQNFCGVINTSGYKPGLTRFPEANDNGTKISVRKNITPGQPDGIVVSAVGSIWLPLPPENVFDLFRDENRRHEWDVLAYGNPVSEVSYIPIGTHAGNRISILKPSVLNETDVLIFQESSIDPLGSYVVYAPLDEIQMNEVVRGHDSSQLPILPSGFMITGDGRAVAEAFNSENGARIGGSLLTVAFQILVCDGTTIGEPKMGTVASVHKLFTNTVQNIKAALNCW